MHKNVPRESNVSSRDAFDVKVITVPRKPAEPLPVVAGVYEDRITLYWWSDVTANNPRWRWRQVLHERLGIGHRVVTQNHLRRLSLWGWSNSVDLTATDDAVILGFKRSLSEGQEPGYYLQAYDTTNDLEPLTAAPVRIPSFGYSRFGYYSWLDFDAETNLLVLVLQGYPDGGGEPDLLVLAVQPPDDFASLSQESAWHQTVVGQGGFAIDARLSESLVHLIFRQDEYAFSVDAGSGSVGAGAADYAPLHYARLRISVDASGEPVVQVVGQTNDLPGAENPQLQTLDPLTFTGDRVTDAVFRADVEDWFGAQFSIAVAESRESQKTLYSHIDAQWFTTPLFFYDDTTVARSPNAVRARWATVDLAIFVPDLEAGRIFCGTPDSQSRVFVTGLGWTSQVGLAFDVLHTDHRDDAIIVSRIEHMPIGIPSDPERSLLAVLDINHGRIPATAELSPRAVLENRSFRQTTRDKLELVGSQEDEAYLYRLRPEQSIEYHVGGRIDLTLSPELSVAYVQPSDGGIRYIALNQFPVEPPVPGSTSISEEAIEWDLDASWITLTAANTGRAYETPPPDDQFAVVVNTWFSGLDPLISAAFLAPAIRGLGSISADGRTLTIEDSDVTDPDLEVVWDNLWLTYDEINDNAVETSEGWLANIGSMRAEISKFDIDWVVDANGRRQSMSVRLINNYRTWYRFDGRERGQGVISLRTNVVIEAPAPQLAQFRDLAKTSINIELEYEQEFTPAILLSDWVRNSATSSSFDAAFTSDGFLTAKPVSDTTARPIVVEARFDWTVGGHFLWNVLPTIVLGLIGFGLQFIAEFLTGLAAAAVAAALSIIGLFVAIGIIATIIGIMEGFVPNLVRTRMREGMLRVDFKEQLDSAGLFQRAGTGLAEEIAFRARTEGQRRPIGQNRLGAKSWEVVYVSDGECRVRTGDMSP